MRCNFPYTAGVIFIYLSFIFYFFAACLLSWIRFLAIENMILSLVQNLKVLGV